MDKKALKKHRDKIVTTAVANVVKQKRLEIGKDIKTLADESGLSETYISDTENGKIAPKLRTVMFFAGAFKMKSSEFVKLVENELAGKFEFHKSPDL